MGKKKGDEDDEARRHHEQKDNTPLKDDEVDLQWIGPAAHGIPKYMKSKKNSVPVKKYEGVKIKIGNSGEFVCGVGDFVHLRTTEQDGEPFIGRVMDLFEDAKGYKLGTVQWMYRPRDIPEDTVGDFSRAGSDDIIYAAEHLDKIALETIIETFRIEFTITASDGVVFKRKSSLFADREDPSPSRPFLYRCSRIFDLSSIVAPITDAMYQRIEKVATIQVDDIDGRKKAKKSVASSTRSRDDSVSGGVEEEHEDATSSDEERESGDSMSEVSGAGRKKPLRTSVRGRRKSKENVRRSTRGSTVSSTRDDVDLIELPMNKKAKAIPQKVGRSARSDSESATEEEHGNGNEKAIGDRSRFGKRSNAAINHVVDDPEFIRRQQEQNGSALGSPLAPTTTSAVRPSAVDVDEKLWAFFQQLRNEIGSDDALEILGYLKLAMLADNPGRGPNHQIAPPPYLQNRMSRPELRTLLSKVLSTLGLSSESTHGEREGSVRRAFEELEKCRPGIIFGQLGQGSQPGHWLFPEGKVASPIFGSLLGLDGFRTCKMTYRKQAMHVPIEREGSVSQAAVHGFSRLVTSSYSFLLIRTGDFTFEVAPSPDEICEPIFIKGTRHGKTLCLYVPVNKALLSFVKVLVREHEGLTLSQQRFRLGDGKQIGTEADDNIPLSQFGIKASSYMNLILAKQ